MHRLRNIGQRIFSGWITLSYRHAAWVLIILLATAAIATVYTARNLGIHTDTTDMLSEELPFRVNLAHFKESFPQYEETLLLVLDAPTPEQAYNAAVHLTARLKADPNNTGEIHHLNGEEFFQTNGLLYKDADELAQLANRLAAAQPLIVRISRDPTLYSFLMVLNDAIEALRTGMELELASILQNVADTLEAGEAGSRKPLSWQTLFQEGTGKNSYRELIILQPDLNFDQLFAGEQIISTIHEAARTLDLENRFSARLRITGDVALSHEELNSAMRGAQNAGILALTGTLIILLLALRSVGSVMTVLISLILGLLMTAAFATFAVGHLNLISIAFAVLYIGLGVDYAIHLLLRYAELKENYPPGTRRVGPEILLIAGHDTGRSLITCALTTAIGFYAFIPTAYNGVAELGLISGTGMLISLIVTLTVLPALQRFLPVRPRSFDSGKIATLLSAHWLHQRKTVFWITILVTLASIATLPHVRFDPNLLNMNDPNGVAVQTFRELLADTEQTPWFGAIPVNSRQEAERLKLILTDLPEVDRVISISDFVPEAQLEKLALLDDIALTLGPDFFTEADSDKNTYTVAQQQAALQTLRHSLNRLTAEKPDHPTALTARELSAAIEKLLSNLARLNTAQAEDLLNKTGQDLLGLLPETLARLQKALTAEAFDVEALPDSLRSRWQSATGDYLVIAYPASNIDDNEALRKFVHTVQQYAPQVSGTPVVILEAGEAIVDAFIQAFSLTLIGILLALLWLLRNIISTLLILAPLLLAALFTVATTVILQIPFNFANVIALPLLLGIGLDSSIHMVLRSHHHLADQTLLQTSTAHAILYSAVTSIASFGSLAFSSHPGTASMGLLLALGLLFILICVFLILPSLLQIFRPRTHDQQA